jgi:hypothetical protein
MIHRLSAYLERKVKVATLPRQTAPTQGDHAPVIRISGPVLSAKPLETNALQLSVVSATLRRRAKGSKIGGKKGSKLDSREGPSGCENLQLVDAKIPCSEGWEGPQLASSPHYA